MLSTKSSTPQTPKSASRSLPKPEFIRTRDQIFGQEYLAKFMANTESNFLQDNEDQKQTLHPYRFEPTNGEV